MALGSRKGSDPSVPLGGPPPMPPGSPIPGPGQVASPMGAPGAPQAATGQVDLASLNARIQELQDTVASLINRPPAPAPEGQVVDESTRTLRMAQQTADAAIAEAKADAEKIVADAKAKADEIVLLGRQAADRELREQREQVAGERRAWESRRQELVAAFTELDLRLTALRDLYEEAHRSVRAALEEPALTTPVPGADLRVVEPPAPEPVLEDEPVEEETPEPVATVPPPTFGVASPPPEPPPGVLGGPAAPDPEPATVGAEQSSPFYAWTPGQHPQGVEPPPVPAPPPSPVVSQPDNPVGPEADPVPPPAPPQRRGLFGH